MGKHTIGVCSICAKENQRIWARTKTGGPVCKKCHNVNRLKEKCCACGKISAVEERLGNNPICRLCYQKRHPEQGFSRYTNEAKRRKYEWGLTKEQFIILVAQPCHYCGNLPDGIIHKYLGIDRKNNLVGYVLDNCVPCCHVCNYAKGTMDYQDFLSMCARIATHHHLVTT